MTATTWDGPVVDVADDRWPTFFGTDEWGEWLSWISRQMGHDDYWRAGLYVYRVTYDVIDCPCLVVEQFVRGEDHALQVDPDDPTKVLRVRTEHAIREPLPCWWRP